MKQSTLLWLIVIIVAIWLILEKDIFYLGLVDRKTNDVDLAFEV